MEPCENFQGGKPEGDLKIEFSMAWWSYFGE